MLQQQGLCLSRVHNITSKQEHPGLLLVSKQQPYKYSRVSVFCVITHDGSFDTPSFIVESKSLGLDLVFRQGLD